MIDLYIGVAQVSLLIRHAQSLKDKRKIVQSLLQKLKNQGFSAAEIAFAEEPKRATLGFSFVANSPSYLDKNLDDALRLFVGDFEVLDSQRRVFDFSGEEETTMSEDDDLKFGLE